MAIICHNKRVKNDSNFTAAVDRFENGLAVLDFGHGQMLNVAKRFLPRNIKEGDVLGVEFLTDAQATKRKQNLARAMLEEILNGE